LEITWFVVLANWFGKSIWQFDLIWQLDLPCQFSNSMVLL
jgi:hypothetical protein